MTFHYCIYNQFLLWASIQARVALCCFFSGCMIFAATVACDCWSKRYYNILTHHTFTFLFPSWQRRRHKIQRKDWERDNRLASYRAMSKARGSRFVSKQGAALRGLFLGSMQIARCCLRAQAIWSVLTWKTQSITISRWAFPAQGCQKDMIRFSARIYKTLTVLDQFLHKLVYDTLRVDPKEDFPQLTTRNPGLQASGSWTTLDT